VAEHTAGLLSVATGFMRSVAQVGDVAMCAGRRLAQALDLALGVAGGSLQFVGALQHDANVQASPLPGCARR